MAADVALSSFESVTTVGPVDAASRSGGADADEAGGGAECICIVIDKHAGSFRFRRRHHRSGQRAQCATPFSHRVESARYHVAMVGFVRPDVPPQVFRDAAGEVIRHGERWAGASPPDDSYSVVSNPERFAPLHVVAEALIRYLTATYDVDVSEDRAFAADLMHTRHDIIRAVRLTPRERDAARLTFVFTSFPSVIIHAGLLQDFLYPICGCDACDETWEGLADEMEWQVPAVVAGRFRERVRSGSWIGMSLEAVDGRGGTSGEVRATDLPTELPSKRLADAEARLNELQGAWLPWTTASATAPPRSA